MKRIIICADGTWNKPGNKDLGKIVQTNVEKIFHLVSDVDVKGIKQVKYYAKGVGTNNSFLDKLLGGVTGRGLDTRIKDLYRFLILMYEAGDEIYLFGFSRGAYTVRSLAGLIRNCGILQTNNIKLLQKAFALYRNREEATSPRNELMENFRRQYAQEETTKIKFIGVWDTVGALGLPFTLLISFNRQYYRFHDTTLSSTIEYAYQALAINEHRKLFPPVLWTKSKNIEKQNEMPQQHIEQRWFIGAHSNIGGGYVQTELSDITLTWIIEKAEKTGLAFIQSAQQNLSPDFKGTIRQPHKNFPYLFCRPIKRDIEAYDCISFQITDDSVRARSDWDPLYKQ